MSIRAQDALERNVFSNGELVVWHYREQNKLVPVPAVVLRHEAGCVIIKAHVQGTFKELSVDPKELMSR